jgi:hypothetical protein
MFNMKALQSAMLIGTALQLAMIVAGHYFAWVALNVFMLGGLAISALAGLLYARGAMGGFWGAALGGAIAGVVCALIGIAASVAWGDTLPVILALGTLGSAITGVLGGIAGQAIFGSRTALT